MNQTLTKNAPVILDATCSFTHIWPKHATIRMDIRSQCKPDIVGDIRKTEFPDHYFDAIYLDPPHMIRKDPFVMPHDILAFKRRLSGRRSPTIYNRYGIFKSREEWIDFLDKVNMELLRILKPGGKTHWKLTFGKDQRYIKESDLVHLTNFKIIERKITKSKKPGSNNKVHWLTMIPLPLKGSVSQ